MAHLQLRRKRLRKPRCPKSSTFDKKQICSRISQASDLRKQMVIKTEWKIWDILLRAEPLKSPILGNFRMRGAISRPHSGIPCPRFGRLWRLQSFDLKPTPTASACRPATDAPADVPQTRCGHDSGEAMSQIFELLKVAGLQPNFAGSVHPTLTWA